MTTIEQYRAHPGINATALKAGATSMLHMHQAMTGAAKESTPAMEWGTLVHRAVLTTEEFTVYPGRRAGKDWEAFEAAALATGRTVVSAKEFEKLATIRARIRENKLTEWFAYHLAFAKIESPIYWEEKGLGQCKALPDFHHGAALVDVKTAKDISERGFTSASWTMGYHLQMAWYRRGLMANGLRVENVQILAIESASPFDIAVFDMDSGLLEYGEKEAVRIATEYRAAEKAGRFPGRYSAPVTLLQPAWADEQVQGLPDEELDPSDI